MAGVNADNDGYICAFDPFIVSLPTLGENLSWIYSVESHPKAVDFRPKHDDVEYSVVKLWRDAGHTNQRPANVEIAIYQNDVLAETVELNAGNEWKYTWKAKDDGSVWHVVETKVPKNYTMTVQKKDCDFTVTNTCVLPSETPQTGDSTNLMLWIVIALAAGATLVVIGVLGKKKKDKEKK